MALAYSDGVTPIENVLLVTAYVVLYHTIDVIHAFRYDHVISMIGYTRGDFKEFDKNAKKVEKLRIKVEIPLNRALSTKQWCLVEYTVEFRHKF